MMNLVICGAGCAKSDEVTNEVDPPSELPPVNPVINGDVKNNGVNGDALKEKSTNSVSGETNDDPNKDPYDHLYRKKTKWELSRLSFTMLGTEMVYSSETALISPLLLMYGMKREHVVLVWAISPIIGLILSPILGSLSDQCKLSIGRRRPFIILLAILDALGLLLIGNSYIVGQFFGDSTNDIFTFSNYSLVNEFTDYEISDRNADDYLYTIICIVIGTILVDFSTDALLNPSRAYVLDVCIADDHNKGLNTSTILAGIGGFFGYIIGSVNWGETFLHRVTGGYARIVFNLVDILFIICIIASITTFKEMPLNNESTPTDVISVTVKTSKNKMKNFLRSIVTMPSYLNVVCLTNLFAWMSHVNFYFYFTHFVGRSVYDGDPTASPNTQSYQLYEEGIRFACFALSVNCVASILYPLVANKMIKKFGMKPVYMATLLLDATGLTLMAVYKNKLMVVIVCAIGGIVYCTSFTMPYMLVAHYHDKDKFANKDPSSTRLRGLGTDLSIVGACVCMAQLINSMYMSKFMTLFGVTFAVIGTSAIFGFLAFVTASQIVI